jgi:tetratricopeptide (TPR) repeat protein
MATKPNQKPMAAKKPKGALPAPADAKAKATVTSNAMSPASSPAPSVAAQQPAPPAPSAPAQVAPGAPASTPGPDALKAQLERINRLIQANDHDTAAATFQRLLREYPKHPGITRQYGVYKLQVQENAAALTLLTEAAALAPHDGMVQKFLGLANLRLNKHEIALTHLEAAEKLTPKEPDVFYFAAQALGSLKKYDEAVKKIGRALQLKPELPAYLHTLGTLFSQMNSDKRALSVLYRALDLQPTLWSARLTLGHVLMRLNRQKEAISHYTEVLRDAPDRIDAITNLGNAYMATEQLGTAEEHFKRLLTLFPKEASVHNNLGNLYSKSNRYEDALINYEKALELKEAYPEAWNNYAITLRRLNRVEESLRGLNKAVEHNKNFPDAFWNRSLSMLLLGQIEQGFEEYEWRWKGGVKEMKPRKFSVPVLERGMPLQGKRILVHSEQGLGDHIQFIRYLPMLQAMGATVLAEFPEALIPISKAYAPDVIWIERGTRKFPEFDNYCALLSLPTILGTSMQTIPATKEYLSAPAGRVQFFADKLPKNQGPKVGIVWSGNPKHQNDRNRSITLERMLQVLQPAKATVVSLMKEVRPDDLTYMKAHTEVLDFSADLDSFSDTAALIKNLDLVIAVDTSVAHLAGALGCPVWTLIPFAPDWRWMLNRSDTPWYPTMTLYRQHKPHDWDGVLSDVRRDFQKICDTHAH